jgi:1-aminocyclopropane-1-carboxylate deaminase
MPYLVQPNHVNITCDEIHCPLFREKNIRVDVLRLDKIHPVISGNKFFKLKYHLQHARQYRYNGVLTFGGAWSNHLVATACAARLNHLPSIGMVRGEKPMLYSETLKQAADFGMQFDFLPRHLYRQKENPEFLHTLQKKYPGYYIIPEGGGGKRGILGASEIMNHVKKENYTHIACAIGTGAMYSGILRNTLPGQKILGIPVLKGFTELNNHLSAYIGKNRQPDCHFFPDYHFGGYARYPAALLEFMNAFYTATSIPTDFVYTAKLFYAISHLARKNFFAAGSRVLVIHSGGLQGNSSLKKGTLNFST